MKTFFTFGHPIQTAVATAYILAVFLCLIVFSDTGGETRCRSSRNCLNTIALFGLDNGNNGTVFCRFHALNPNKTMQNNQKNQSEVIENFLQNCGEATGETIKEMYRGWLNSELADGVMDIDRANNFFNVEIVVKLVESLWALDSQKCAVI